MELPRPLEGSTERNPRKCILRFEMATDLTADIFFQRRVLYNHPAVRLPVALAVHIAGTGLRTTLCSFKPHSAVMISAMLRLWSARVVTSHSLPWRSRLVTVTSMSSVLPAPSNANAPQGHMLSHQLAISTRMGPTTSQRKLLHR